MHPCVVALCGGEGFPQPVFSGYRRKSGKCWSVFLSGHASGPLEAMLTQNNVLKKRAPGKGRRCLHHPMVAKAVLWCCVTWHWTDPCRVAPLICGSSICPNISTYLKHLLHARAHAHKLGREKTEWTSMKWPHVFSLCFHTHFVNVLK